MNILQSIISYFAAFVLAIAPAPTYTEGMVGQPQSFLPSQATTQIDRTISKLIYKGLFRYDIYGALIPDLADTWEVSEDGLVYTVKIKDNQYWSDGKKVTSDDLIYTAFKTADLSGVGTDKVDELTVRYILPNEFSPFLSLLTAGVMPMNAEEKQNPLVPVSNGAFRVLRVEKNGPAIQRVILYKNLSQAAIRKVVFKFYVNDEELSLGARLGEIDGFLHSNSALALDNFSKYEFPIQGVYYALFFNLRNETLSDIALREKLAQSLPVRNLIEPCGIPVEGAISRSIYTDKAFNFYYYDKDFVPESNELSLEITVPDIKQHVQLVEEVRTLWEHALGINITVRRVAPEAFYELVVKPRDFEVLLYGQEIGRDPDRYIYWHSTQKDDPGLNLTGFEYVRADRALEEGRRILAGEDREIHYNEVQKVINENIPAIFLYHPFANYYISDYITGVGEKYTFSLSDRFLDFDNWKRLRTN